jgi:hypothetical protein
MRFRKIINDPVYGFITIDDALIYSIISHPWFQRLRRINQMALAHLVYPGAVHSRLHHALGAYHLMCNALEQLTAKGIEITKEEEQAAKIAILLHDIGHGPYSHALEHTLVDDHSHENISLLIMEELNVEFKGQLSMAIDIFKNIYPKKFLHQLVSGQLDVDRMDYLNRDSFFTGVTEGVIAYDRILKMITVYNGNLMIEEKGIYSIEKFLVSRRLMYWQVYLHKTVLCAEQMLIKIIERAKAIKATSISPVLNIFLTGTYRADGVKIFLKEFCQLDDVDVFSAIKNWTTHPDKILSFLSIGIADRKLLKVKFFERPIPDELIEKKINDACRALHVNSEEAHYVVFNGYVENRTYNSVDERIHILFKDGTVKNVSDVDNALINQTLSGTVKKFYICYNR